MLDKLSLSDFLAESLLRISNAEFYISLVPSISTFATRDCPVDSRRIDAISQINEKTELRELVVKRMSDRKERGKELEVDSRR